MNPRKKPRFMAHVSLAKFQDNAWCDKEIMLKMKWKFKTYMQVVVHVIFTYTCTV